MAQLGRRRFLTGAGFACVCCRAAFAQSAHGTAPHWSYEGEAGPAHWAELSPAFNTCSIGMQQSPIDLANGITTNLGDDLHVAYRPIPLHIVNNGHTIQVNAEPGGSCSVAGTRYELLQFHFHHPSEHLLAGKAFDLECHLVHQSASGALAVLGVLLRAGEENAALRPIWNAMPHAEGERVASGSIDPGQLLPQRSEHYRYMGSLTTPPCSEGVTWTVYRDPITASEEQIRQFAALFANNARPAQAPNRRTLSQNF